VLCSIVIKFSEGAPQKSQVGNGTSGKDTFVMNESFINELKKYENGRVLLDPPVRSILRGVTNYEWVLMSVDNKIVTLQSTPGDYRLELSPSFILEIKELPQKSDGINRATLVLKDSIEYKGRRFESALFPKEVRNYS
jgi:hypothetical protein